MTPRVTHALRRVANLRVRSMVGRVLVVDAGLGMATCAVAVWLPLMTGSGPASGTDPASFLEPTDPTTTLVSTTDPTSTPPTTDPSTPPTSTAPPPTTSSPPSTTSRPPSTSRPPATSSIPSSSRPPTLGSPPTWATTASGIPGTGTGTSTSGLPTDSSLLLGPDLLGPDLLFTGLLPEGTGSTGGLPPVFGSVLPTVSERSDAGATASTTGTSAQAPSEEGSLASTIGWGSLAGGLLIGVVGIGSFVFASLHSQAKHRG